MINKINIKNCALYHGDCYEVMRQISGADCMITDPPYGCTNNDWDKDIDLEKFWRLGTAACKENAAFVIFCQMPFAARLYMSNPKMFRYEWIYKKPVYSGFLNANYRPLRTHELIYVFSQNHSKYNQVKGKGGKYHKMCSMTTKNYGEFNPYKAVNETGERCPTSILAVNHENTFYTKPKFNCHPTQKSVAALSYLVKTYTDMGDTVIDPFMGSGSTGVAAVKHGRKFIGIEQDAKWFAVACKRIEAEYEENSLLDLCGPQISKSDTHLSLL